MDKSGSNAPDNSAISEKKEGHVPAKKSDADKKKESIKDIVSIAKRNIDERQKRIRPYKAEVILNKLSSGVSLNSRDKAYAVTFGRNYLSPEQNRLLVEKKKGIAQYGILASFVALSTGLAGGFLSRRFVKAKLLTQLMVFGSLFSASSYFQMYPIVADYTKFNDQAFEEHKDAMLSYLARHHTLYLEEERSKKKQPSGSKEEKSK